MSTSNLSTRAYVVDHVGGPFELRDVILDGVQEGEVLVEVLYTGICHTDLVVKDGGMPVGSFPAVLGHEGLGIVRQVGSNMSEPSLKIGDTVILSFHSCRECQSCIEGRYGACPAMTETNFVNTARRHPRHKSPFSLTDGTAVHGQFFGQSSLSKMTIATEKSVVKIDAEPADLPHLAPLACGYFTGASTVLNVLEPKKTDSIAVIGMGAVGIAAVMAAKSLGLKDIIAIDIVDSKLRAATEVGASHTINTTAFGSLDEGVKSIFPGGVDQIIDATGVVPVIEVAVRALAHGGTLALVGVPAPGKTIRVDPLDLLTSCKRIIGVIEGLSSPQETIPKLLRLYHDGKFPINKLSTIYEAQNMVEAIEDLKNGRVIKPILSWSSVA